MNRTRAEAVIRPFESADRPAVRDIAYRTACRCRGASLFPGLSEPIADYLTIYYTDYESGSVQVLEKQGRVTGYLLGCSDTSRYIRLMGGRIIPRILCAMPRYLLKSGTHDITSRILGWLLLHAWRETPPVPFRTFTAHFHLNLLPGSYGSTYASRMLLTFLERLDRLDVSAVHFAITERKNRGAYKGMTDRYRRHHPDAKLYYSERPSSFHRVVFGNTEPMTNRVWGCSVEDLIAGVEMMALTFRL